MSPRTHRGFLFHESVLCSLVLFSLACKKITRSCVCFFFQLLTLFRHLFALFAEVARSSATTYSFNTDKGNRLMDEQPDQETTKIGTNYERIANPAAVIAGADEREKFWADQIKDDENRRKLEDAKIKKREEEAAADLKTKEAASAKERAKIVKERTLQISKLERPQDIVDSNTGPMWKGGDGNNAGLRQSSVNSVENSKTTV